MRTRHAQRGVVLIATFFIALIMAGLVGVTMTRTITEAQAVRLSMASMNAVHAAEAGVDLAISELADDADYVGTDADDNDLPDPADPPGGEWLALLENTFYWIDVTDLGGSLRQVEVTGRSGVIVRQLEVVVELPAGGLPRAAVVTDGPIFFSGGVGGSTRVVIEGDLLANYAGNGTIVLRDTDVLQSASQSGSVILAGVPEETTPTLYIDRGRSSTPTRLPSTIAGEAYAIGSEVTDEGEPVIDPRFEVNDLTAGLTVAPVLTEGQARHVALVGRTGPQQTVVEGTIKLHPGFEPVSLPQVPEPSLAPITVGALTFANDCTHEFHFTENDNSLTQSGGDLDAWAGTGKNRLRLPAGEYCFESFNSTGTDNRLLFDGPATVYVTGGDVNVTTYSRINWKVKISGIEYTRPPEDLWLLVSEGGNVNFNLSRMSGSLYAPDSTVDIFQGSGGAEPAIFGMAVAKSMTLLEEAHIGNFGGLGLPEGVEPPIGFGAGGHPTIQMWRETR